MVQLGIAILVNDEAHNLLRRWQLSIANACGRNPALHQIPHITLKQPFHAKALEPLERYFDELAASVTPLEIRLTGVGVFESDGVVFLDVAPNERLDRLRRRVLADLTDRFGIAPREVEDEQYRFHASIGYNLSAEAFVKACAAVEGVDVDLRFTVRALGLFYYTGELWILYKRGRITSAPGG